MVASAKSSSEQDASPLTSLSAGMKEEDISQSDELDCCRNQLNDKSDTGPIIGMTFEKLGSLHMLSEITLTVSQLSLDDLEPSGMEKLNQDGHLDNIPRLPSLHRSSIISIPPESLVDSTTTCASTSSDATNDRSNGPKDDSNAVNKLLHGETTTRRNPQMSYLALQREGLRALFESDCPADAPPRQAQRIPSIDATGDEFTFS